MTIVFGNPELYTRILRKQLANASLTREDRSGKLKFLNEYELTFEKELMRCFTVELPLAISHLHDHTVRDEEVVTKAMQRMFQLRTSAEFGHPSLSFIEGQENRNRRILTIDLEYVCCAFDEPCFVSETKQLFARMKPVGPYSEPLWKFIRTRLNQKNFGLRAITDPHSKTINEIITWDFIGKY